jgi:hypothetical protein
MSFLPLKCGTIIESQALPILSLLQPGLLRDLGGGESTVNRHVDFHFFTPNSRHDDNSLQGP